MANLKAKAKAKTKAKTKPKRKCWRTGRESKENRRGRSTRKFAEKTRNVRLAMQIAVSGEGFKAKSGGDLFRAPCSSLRLTAKVKGKFSPSAA